MALISYAECKKKISDTINCRYQLTPQKSCSIRCFSVIVFFFILYTIGCSSDKNSNQPVQQPQVNQPQVQNNVSVNDLQIGQEGYLRLPGNDDKEQVICLGKTKDDADAISKALIKKDFMGLLEIPGAFGVGNGSRVLLIERDFPLRRVRILEGVNDVDKDKVGLSGWVTRELVVNK